MSDLTTPLSAGEIEEIKEDMPRLVELTDRLDGAGGFTGLSCSEHHELAQSVRPLFRLLAMLTAPLAQELAEAVGHAESVLAANPLGPSVVMLNEPMLRILLRHARAQQPGLTEEQREAIKDASYSCYPAARAKLRAAFPAAFE